MVEVVAPFAGAWIEIIQLYLGHGRVLVAPFAGAWIEIYGNWTEAQVCRSRSLRGSVD